MSVKDVALSTHRVLGESIRLMKKSFLTRLINFTMWLASAQYMGPVF